MANPNPEIWGDSSNWLYSDFAYGLTSDIAKNGNFDKPKVNNFGGTDNINKSTLIRAIEQNKLVRNEYIDNTICPCGQAPDVSPFAKIAIFNEENDLSTTPRLFTITDSNINWFFADRLYTTPSNCSYSYSTTYYDSSHTDYSLAFQQYAPKTRSDADATNSASMQLSPYVYYGTKSLLLSIEVRLMSPDAEAPAQSSWRTLDRWKNDYPTYSCVGMRLFVRNCLSYNNNQLTYNNDEGISTGVAACLCVTNPIPVTNNGVSTLTQFLTQYTVGFSQRYAYIFESTPNIYTYNDYRRSRAVLPCWNYFEGQTLNRYIADSNTCQYYYKIPYNQANYNKMMSIAALFGCYFTPTNKYEFGYDMLDNDLYLTVLDETGVAHGQYTKGAENANNSLYTKNSIRDIDYDPTTPPTPVDPNTYSDTTNWNNVDFRQAFTKRYLLTGSHVAQLSSELWAAQSSKPADIDYNNFAIDEYLTNNPIDTVVSLKYFPCTFTDTAPAVVHLGKYTTNIAATALGTSVRIIDFAPIECFPHFGDFRDFEPYTELAMYVPFCGTVKIPTAECMGNYVSVKLAIDTSTGAATGYIIVSKTGSGGICVATCQGMAAIDIPVSGLQSANLANAVFNATANWAQTQVNNISANSGLFKHMGGTFGTIARGMSNSFNFSDVKGGILGGPIGAVGTLVNSLNPISALQKGMNIDIDNAKADYELSHIQVPTRLVGSASPVLGCVIELDCRLIIYRPVTDENALSNYADTVGFATVQGGTVGQFSGFTVGTIDVSGINATAKEKQAIAAAFANGVYL